MSKTNDYTDAGALRKSTAGAKIGWHKNTKNMDIRDMMKERGIGQAKLANILGISVTGVNHMLNKDLPWNIRDCLIESIKRYDPETNPHGR